jgi:hypothetical protein
VLALLAAAALAVSAAGQEKPPAPKKKPRAAAKGSQLAHTKPTPQQVRKFEELEQKHEGKQPERKREPK